MKAMMTVLAVMPLFFTACSKQSTHTADPQTLAEHKCASCHNLDMPPKTSDKELAPPLFTVTVHLKDWIKSPNPADDKSKFVDFLKDYVINPSRDKSYCDPKSLALYGVMPSQKGKVTKEEVGEIANYIYDKYDQIKMLKILQERNRIKALPLYQQVLETHDCKYCHVSGAGRVAPSFAAIGKRYQKEGVQPVISSILHGSKGKWKQYHAFMRGYSDIPPKQLEAFAKWVLQQGSKAQ